MAESIIHIPLVNCGVLAWGTAVYDAPRIALMRKNPGIWAGKPVAPTLLKHAEDQTVAALALTLETMGATPCPGESWHDWGVISAADFFGRATIAQSLHRFEKEGAWGISAHLIPNCSLHAVSGAISLAVRMHGPNFGISGGPDAAAEAFGAAAGLLGGEDLPGLWLTMTSHDPEMIPDKEASLPAAPVRCFAVVLALTPQPMPGRPTLSWGPENAPVAREFTLAEFLQAWEKPNEFRSWRLPEMNLHLNAVRT